MFTATVAYLNLTKPIFTNHQQKQCFPQETLKITDKNFSNSIKFLSLLSTIKNL